MEILKTYPSPKSAYRSRQIKCQFFMCNATKELYPHRVFFYFPVDRGSCDQWVINCANEALTDLTYTQLRSRAVCAKHFTRPCFTSDLGYRLEKGAVPTLLNVNDDTPVISTISDISSSIKGITKQTFSGVSSSSFTEDSNSACKNPSTHGINITETDAGIRTQSTFTNSDEENNHCFDIIPNSCFNSITTTKNTDFNNQLVNIEALHRKHRGNIETSRLFGNSSLNLIKHDHGYTTKNLKSDQASFNDKTVTSEHCFQNQLNHDHDYTTMPKPDTNHKTNQVSSINSCNMFIISQAPPKVCTLPGDSLRSEQSSLSKISFIPSENLKTNQDNSNIRISGENAKINQPSLKNCDMSSENFQTVKTSLKICDMPIENVYAKEPSSMVSIMSDKNKGDCSKECKTLKTYKGKNLKTYQGSTICSTNSNKPSYESPDSESPEPCSLKKPEIHNLISFKEDRLKQKLAQIRKMYIAKSRQLKRLQEKKPKFTQRELFNLVASHIKSGAFKTLLKMQLLHNFGNVWDEDEKQLALEMFCMAPEFFKDLRCSKGFKLPSHKTIKKWLGEMGII